MALILSYCAPIEIKKIMKKLLITLIFCGSLFVLRAQEASVEKSTFGVQTGWFGIWLYNEAKLSNEIVLRSEIGLTGEFYFNGYYENTWFLVAPSITLEPKWYYNIKRRNEKGKSIVGNSANFISLSTTFIPDWFYATNNDDLTYLTQISIIPTWGIRRNIGKNFNYEVGAGIGYGYIIKNSGNAENESEVAINFHLRIGYKF